MPWIENVAHDDIPKGWHHDAGPNSMLISITDPDMNSPVPKHSFAQMHCFKFLDVEDDDGFPDEVKCSPEDAAALCELLKYALEHRMNVVVHCFAGICRSGAVAEVGTMMGFDDCERFRAPNLRVKRLMMDYMGWGYKDE